MYKCRKPRGEGNSNNSSKQHYYNYFLKEEIYVYNTNFIKVSVPIQKSELSCMFVRGIHFVSVSKIFQLDFGTVPTV